MAKAKIVQKTGNNYKLEANGTIVFRSFSRKLSNVEENDMLKDVYDKKAGKTKKEKIVNVQGCDVKKSKVSEFKDYLNNVIEPMKKAKADSLNV
mgnify:CR=1 FL=1